MKTIKSSNMNRGSSILSLLFLGLFIIVLARFIFIMTTGHIHGVNLIDSKEKLITNKETLKSTRGEILKLEKDKN
ncbi:hypothetical protein [Metabacillus niabensis]|uniref:hypothetical protein n=1 Tax=Metabacillus niabensis TaxID=324854 RepID=UPI0039A22B10